MQGGTLACVLKGRSMTLACGDRVRVAREAAGGAIVDDRAAPQPALSLRRVQGKADRRERDAGARRRRARRARRRASAESLDRRGGDRALPLRAGRRTSRICRTRAQFAARFASYAALGYAVVQRFRRTRYRGAAPAARRAAQRRHRPVGHGEIDADQRAPARRRRADRRDLRGAAQRPPHDDVDGALPLARRRPAGSSTRPA